MTLPKEISENDLPDSTPLKEKITATINMSLPGGAVDVSLVEASSIAGLNYEEIADTARSIGLDVDEMNENGLGIADSEEDVKKAEPEGILMKDCSNCGSTEEMSFWSDERGGWHITKVECNSCGQEGSQWSAGVGDPYLHGVLSN
jgi:Zn ribbon nucleic-acid-binding protein